MARLICVSNRVTPPTGRSDPAGGLAVALRDALRSRGGLWFGWSGEVGPETGGRMKQRTVGGVTYATVDLGEQDHRGFYAGFANGTLWPLFHFRIGLVAFDRAQAARYAAVNEAYARALLPLLAPDDQIWIHDYHLFPMAAALRRLGVTNRIGFFLHIPFPPWPVLLTLPGAVELMRGLLAYDLIGVQTQRDLRGLHDCFAQGLGLVAGANGAVRTAERAVCTGAYPIGIDAEEFARQAAEAVHKLESLRFSESLVGRALVIGAERLDYTKGLPERMLGFERLLQRFPAHRRNVTYLQVAARSRFDVSTYRDLRRQLDQIAGRINGDYGEADWTPVRYVARAVPRPILAGYFRQARIGLVTPLRDGMNLVAKEFVAAQNPDDPGVLLLSPFAGAAEEMDAALIVNPLDIDAVAEALDRAVTMPLEERIERWENLMSGVRKGTADVWAQGFLADLARCPG